METADKRLTALAKRYVNLTDASLGAEALFASDEFFAAKERMLNPQAAVFDAGRYDEHGKWMDGWETRRKRDQGFDYCVLRLAVPGLIKVVDLDTRFFTGNYAPLASLQACNSAAAPSEITVWQEIMPPVPLRGDTSNLFAVDSDQAWTHVKLNIFPDGGIARLRVYGEAHCDWSQRDPSALIDLIAFENGGKALECSDEHYGTPRNLLKPGRGANMGDGWETQRRREPGFDWVILKLGHPGEVDGIEIDTAHFKGNFPDRVSILAARLQDDCDRNLAPRSLNWKSLLAEQPLQADKQHFFESELENIGPITHIRVDIHPDGGLSRVRLFGHAVFI